MFGRFIRSFIPSGRAETTCTYPPHRPSGSATNPGILNTVDTSNALEGDDHIVLAVAVQGVIGADGVVPAEASFELSVSGFKDASGTIPAGTGSITFSGRDTQVRRRRRGFGCPAVFFPAVRA